MKMASKKEICTCPKCNGSGYIDAYRGIANGVCFTCNGAGKVAYRPTAKKVRPLTPCQVEMIETIKTGDLSKMTYNQLNSLRNSAHWHYPQCPDLLAIWRERGDPFFFAAQEARLAAY